MKHVRWLAALALMLLLLAFPEAAAAGALSGAAQWYARVAPALFPFMALLPLITCDEALAVYEAWLGRPMSALFRLPGAAAPAFVVGMLGGSPAGAVAVRRVAARADMTQGQLQRLSASVCGLSPAFLIGGVGAGLLGSAAQGRLLLRAQAFSQLALALLLRRAWDRRDEPVHIIEETRAEPPVRGAVLGVLGVCGYMALFGAIARVACRVVGDTWGRLLLCALDMPSGAAIVAQSAPQTWRLPALAGLCGLCGACILAQNLAVLRDCGVRPVSFCAARLLAALLNVGYIWVKMKVTLQMPVYYEWNPMQISALTAAILAVPALIGLKNQILNTAKTPEKMAK